MKIINYVGAQLYFLQNDLVQGWGLDMKLGYCAQVRNMHFLDTFGGCSCKLFYFFVEYSLNMC